MAAAITPWHGGHGFLGGRSGTIPRQDILQFRQRNVAVSFSRRAFTAIRVAWSALDGVTRSRPPSRPARPDGGIGVTTLPLRPPLIRPRTSTVPARFIRSPENFAKTSP